MLTQERVKELFDYEDGHLIRKTDEAYNAQSGDTVGYVSNCGYLRVNVDGKKYLVHRVIFLMHNGYLPKVVDHVDRDRLNNNIDNLRDSSYAMNNCNKLKRKNCSSIYIGVTWDKDLCKWRASCGINQKFIHLGVFTDEKKAAIARDKFIKSRPELKLRILNFP